MSDSLQPRGLYTVHGTLQARILEGVAFPFSRGSSQPKDRTQMAVIEGGFSTSWATRKAWGAKSLWALVSEAGGTGHQLLGQTWEIVWRQFFLHSTLLRGEAQGPWTLATIKRAPLTDTGHPLAQGPSVASFILHLGLCGLVQGSAQNTMGDGMRGLSQESALTELWKEWGKDQSGREATGSEEAPANPFGQPSTKIGQPREGPLAGCVSVPCPYWASGGTRLGQSRGEQGQVERPGISASYHPLPVITVFSVMVTTSFAVAHSRSVSNTVFWREKKKSFP